MVPRDVKEFNLGVANGWEKLVTNLICHLAVIKAQNLQHLKSIAHRNDALNHLLGNRVVAEVEGEESTKVAHGINHTACPFWQHL